MESIKKFLTGKYSLVFTFWIVTVPTILILRFVYFLINPTYGSILEIGLVFLILIIGIIFCFGIWTSASYYQGSKLWKILAKLFCISNIILGSINFYNILEIKITSISNEAKGKIIVDFFDPIVENDCNSAYTKSITLEFIFVEKSNSIFVKGVGNEPKNQFMKKLSECEIIDSKNWFCGGNILKSDVVLPKYQVINGKFSYLNGSIIPGYKICETKWSVR